MDAGQCVIAYALVITAIAVFLALCAYVFECAFREERDRRRAAECALAYFTMTN